MYINIQTVNMIKNKFNKIIFIHHNSEIGHCWVKVDITHNILSVFLVEKRLWLAKLTGRVKHDGNY